MSKQKNRNKNKKITLIVIAAVLGLALLLAGGVGITILTSPANKVCEYVKEGEFEKAERLYKSEVRRNDLHKLILTKKLSGYDQTIFEQFEKGETDYQSASEALEVMKEMGFSSVGQYTDKLTEIHKADEAFANAQKLQAKNDYENAITEYLKISSDSKHYQTAQTELNKLYTDYISSTVNSASQYSAEKNFDLAVQVINNAYDILPDSVDTASLDTVKATILETYKTEVSNQIAVLTLEANWTEAFDLINDAIAFDANDYFYSLKTSTEDTYTNSIADTVQEHLDNEDYISAKRVVDNALTILPDNVDLKALQLRVEKATPIYLLDVLEPYSKEGYKAYTHGETFKSGGNTYTNGFTLYMSNFAIFNINSSYTTLSFTVGHVDDTSKKSATIKIYCDDILKEEISLNANDLPQKVTIDITGVNQLKFAVTDTKDWPHYGFGNITVK